MRISAILAGMLLALAAPAASQSVKAGIEAWQREDYAAAVAIWRPLAQKGDADAAFNLGQAYRMGRGVPLDLATAQGWLERAARKGHVDAQTTLGLLLFQNGNRTGGLRWLRSAADGGDARAQLVYGTALFNGDAVPRDPVRAYAYVNRAAAQGLTAAKETLAEMDRIMPIEQRRKGISLALGKASAAPAPEEPKAEPKAAEIKEPAKAAPAKKEAAKPVASSGGRWRIQLGAFSKRESAEGLFKRLAGKDAIKGKTHFLVAAGSVTRLQVGPFESRAAAQAACAGLKPQPCFPVGP
jgi:TPR repeat protein